MITLTQDDLLRRAGFVFVGVLRATHASAMPEVQASASTAIVDIEEVLVAPPAFQSRRGAVTLSVKDVPALEAGARRAFYCTTWKLGSGLALHCLGHRVPEPSTRRLAGKPLAEASVNQQGADMRTRVESANLVVAGEVLSIEPGPPQEGPISEHDPHWLYAKLRVNSAVRGRKPSKPVTLAFPGSEDVVWKDAPRPVVAQQGVWLLHRAGGAADAAKAARGLEALPSGVYTALHPLDVLPTEKLPLVRDLLSAAQRAPAVKSGAAVAIGAAAKLAAKATRKTPR
jgi:hypothetical protein